MRKDFDDFQVCWPSSLGVFKSVFLLMYARIFQVFIRMVAQPWLVQISMLFMYERILIVFDSFGCSTFGVSKSFVLLMYIRI